jgi:transcriptional regulator with XRE-family HTH domain
MEHSCKTLGCYISCLLGSRLTQKDLARRLNVSPQAVSQWLSNTKRPEKRTLLQICLILRGIPETAFKLACYEFDPLEKSWFMEMQLEQTPLRNEYDRMKRQVKYLRQIMKSTDLQLAIDFGNDLRETLSEYSKRDVCFLPLLFDVLDELCQLYLFTCNLENLGFKIKPVFAEMRQIQQETDSNALLGRLLNRQGDALHLAGLSSQSKLDESINVLNRASRLIDDPNRLMDILRLSCVNLSHRGNRRQFDKKTNLLESKIEELGTQISTTSRWSSYERLAITNATMWDRFKEPGYFSKSREMLFKSRELFNLNQINGDTFIALDLRMQRAELRLAYSHIIELTEEEKLQKAGDILSQAKKLGDPKIVSQMSEFVGSQGSRIPDLTD